MEREKALAAVAAETILLEKLSKRRKCFSKQVVAAIEFNQSHGDRGEMRGEHFLIGSGRSSGTSFVDVGFIAEGPPELQSTAHRVVLASEYLKKRGYSVSLFYGKIGRFLGHRYTHVRPSSHLAAMKAVSRLGLIVVHRAADPIVASIVAIAKRKNVPVIFDLDDSIYLRFNPLAILLRKMLRSCDAITAGSHSIAEYCSNYNENVQLIMGWVDTNLFGPPPHRPRSAIPTIGWLGDGRVHERNLALLVDPLVKLAKRETFRLKLVSSLGSTAIEEAFRPLEALIPIDYGHDRWVNMRYVPSLMSDFDISVMPLEDTQYNRGKGGQKLLESMSMEIPVVGSNVGENKEIVAHGRCGFLADTPDEWVEAISSLLHDENLRSRLGKQGRKEVLDRYSVEVSGRRFESLICNLELREPMVESSA